MWIKADMHIHSTYSDGRNSPREILYYAIYKDIKVISITDHDTFQGSIVALREVKEYSGEILVIIGNEVRTEKGDVLVYCYEPINTPRDVGSLIDHAHENNCLVVPAHPFDMFRLGIGEAIYDYTGWDAIEVWNASANKSANRRAMDIANQLGLPGLANSDAHIIDYIGSAYTLIDVNELSVEEVFKSIRKNRVRPHYGYPPFRVFLKKLEWSIIRRLMKQQSNST